MRSRRGSTAQQEAVARRLAQLDAELSAVRDESLHEGPGDPGDPDGPDAWDIAPPAPWPPPPTPWPVPDSHTRPVPIDRVPEPGRHASRRTAAAVVPAAAPAVSSGWAGLVPDTLRGGAGLSAAHLAVVAVLVSIGLGVTCWWVLRSGPEPLPATAPVGALVTPSGPAVPAPSGATAGSSAAAGAVPSAPPAPGTDAGADAGAEVVVDVAGKVRRPGIAVLPGGSRVADALEAAGGTRPGVDLTSLNLARVLLDGEQILVGVAAAPGVPAAPAPTSPAVPGTTGAPVALVNINTADLAQLDTLPGVGPVTAQAILDWRTENGGFTAVDDLLDVSGIGEVTLAELSPLVTV